MELGTNAALKTRHRGLEIATLARAAKRDHAVLSAALRSVADERGTARPFQPD